MTAPIFGKDPIYWDVGGIPVAALPSPDGSVSIRAFDVPGDIPVAALLSPVGGGSVLAFDVRGGRPFSLNVARDEGFEISEADFLALKAKVERRATAAAPAEAAEQAFAEAGQRQGEPKDLYLNGVLVGQVPRTGDRAADVLVARQYLKDKGLYREVTVAQAMFRQADSFSRVAALLYADLTRKPSSGFTIAPFVVNLTFSIELYLKTLGQIHGATLKGHDLSELFGELPAGGVAAVDAARLKVTPPGTRAMLESTLRELASVFLQWRYVYERQGGPEVKVQPAIWAANVLHVACTASGQT